MVLSVRGQHLPSFMIAHHRQEIISTTMHSHCTLQDGTAETEAAGIIVVCASHMAFVCRMFPDMAILHSIHLPDGLPPGTVAYASWCPRYQQPQSRSMSATSVPHATLAIAWDKKVTSPCPSI